MKPEYTDFYDLLERFSIMAESIGDSEAFNYLRNRTTKDLLNRLQAVIWTNNHNKQVSTK